MTHESSWDEVKSAGEIMDRLDSSASSKGEIVKPHIYKSNGFWRCNNAKSPSTMLLCASKGSSPQAAFNAYRKELIRVLRCYRR